MACDAEDKPPSFAGQAMKVPSRKGRLLPRAWHCLPYGSREWRRAASDLACTEDYRVKVVHGYFGDVAEQDLPFENSKVENWLETLSVG